MSSPYPLKVEVEADIAQLRREIKNNYQGTIVPTSAAPTKDGFFAPEIGGTYTNYGGIVVDLTNTLVFISVTNNQTVFKELAIPLTVYPAKTTFDPLDNTRHSTDKALADFFLPLSAPAASITEKDINNWNSVEQYYGVEWDITQATTQLTRVGILDLHRTLPIQSKMRRCLLNDDGSVNYYLSATNSLKKEDNVTDAILDGTDGQVMTKIPAHYRKFEVENDLRRILISEVALAGFTYIPTQYVSAYEATVERSTSKLASVVNLTPNFRGGNNNATNDLANNTLLGMPATSISRTNFTTYARNRGSVNWNQYLYDSHKTLAYLFYVEFAELNAQTAFNDNLTAQGFKQGGLGIGVTDAVSGDWSIFNGQNPFIPCGTTNSLGNYTGVVNFAPTGWVGNKVFEVSSYRGIENPFGHIWKWMEGINLKIQADDAGGKSEVYVADGLIFRASDYANYTKVGEATRQNGYIKEMITNELIAANTIDASASTYFSDYFYTSIPATGESLRGVLAGGYAYNGSSAGFGYSFTNYAPSVASTRIGSRLCFVESE